MKDHVVLFVNTWVKLFFLLTPFFALSMFLALTRGSTERQRRTVAWQVSAAAGVLGVVLFFFGNAIFAVFGITLDAFRVGAGALLFLSAAATARGSEPLFAQHPDEDTAVVPLATPVIVGPATVGTLLVLGAELPNLTDRIIGLVALILAVVCVGGILFLGAYVERILGKKGINVLSKVTGLVLAALAAQMILTGLRNFFVK